MAKLGDVCEFFSGTGFPNVYQGQKTGKYPFYKVGDISQNVTCGNKELKKCNNYIDEDTVHKIKGCILPPNTIVFAKIGEALKLNRRAITSCHCLIDNNAMGILPDNTKLDVSYFYYFMCTVDLQRYCESTTVPSVRKTRISDIEIPLPPISEQRRIASILDKVTDLIAKRRAQLEKLDLLVKSRFVEMFGTERDFSKWNIAKVEDVAEVCVGVVIKPSQYYAEVGIKAFRSLNIGVMNVKNSDWVYFSEEGHLKNAKSTVHEGDILVVRSGAPGTACVVTKEYDGCNAVDIIIARPNSKKINSVFLAAFTNYPHGMNQIQKGTGGAAQQHFNVGQYKTMQIILPPLDLQNEFALYFHQTETTKSNIQKSLETLETLKKALMQEYFG